MTALSVGVPWSKSVEIRREVVASWTDLPYAPLPPDSDDVRYARSALRSLLRGERAYCGASGAAFRFLALRASRVPGDHLLTGTPALLRRPHADLCAVIAALGAVPFPSAEGLRVVSRGWRDPGVLRVPLRDSSQVASGVVLSAWELPFDLVLDPVGDSSRGYLDLTLDLALRSGMSLSSAPDGIRIRRDSRVSRHASPERCLSSAFSLAAVAVARSFASSVRQELLIPGASLRSLQPDRLFADLLRVSGACGVLSSSAGIRLYPGKELSGLEVSLNGAPDLFPCLAALFSLGEGSFSLLDAPQLRGKESDRVSGIAALLPLLGRIPEERPYGLGASSLRLPPPGGPFDPRGDHRLAMAAAVGRAAGIPIRITDPSVVSKSWPGFWKAFNSVMGRGHRGRRP